MRFAKKSALVLMFSLSLIACEDSGVPATPAPATSASPTPLPTASAASASGTSLTQIGTDSGEPVASLPPDLTSVIEAAFSRCENTYLQSLKTRGVSNPAVERVMPYLREPSAANDSTSYYLRLNSNFVYKDPASVSGPDGPLLREVGRCRVRVTTAGQLAGTSSTTYTEPYSN